jgi:hypothetical protein
VGQHGVVEWPRVADFEVSTDERKLAAEARH